MSYLTFYVNLGNMLSTYHILLTTILAFIGTSWIHPKILNIAIMKNLVDNPDARKLQRRPIPLMGGIAVFFGIIIGLCSSQALFYSPSTFMLVASMLVMLYIGTIDDIIDLPFTTRFLAEILIVCWLMFIYNASIDCFWNVWGLWVIPSWISIPLTIFACVGIINSINLIDGVNGLSSGFCFMASVLFAIFFYHSGNVEMLNLAISTAGAIIPFFLHNVFGERTRMFIGDGGTLVIGTMMSMFVISILQHDSNGAHFVVQEFGLIPFTLAVLSIPVFDTIRVMSIRIKHGLSPFSPDKRHLHHLFIDLGFSHIGTTFCILSLNLLIVISWYISYKLGASIDTQLYVVLVLGITFTFLLYLFGKKLIKKDGKGLKRAHAIAKLLSFENSKLWKFMQRMVDKI